MMICSIALDCADKIGHNLKGINLNSPGPSPTRRTNI